MVRTQELNVTVHMIDVAEVDVLEDGVMRGIVHQKTNPTPTRASFGERRQQKSDSASLHTVGTVPLRQ